MVYCATIGCCSLLATFEHLVVKPKAHHAHAHADIIEHNPIGR